MRRTGSKMSHALVVLPLTLAVLLVALCVPVTCFAGPEPAAAAPAAPAADAACGHGTGSGLTPMTHGGTHSAPRPAWPAHQHGDPAQCKHIGANQAVTYDKSIATADVVAVPAVVAPVVPSPAPLALVLNERPSRPPGIVLTVSQLRI